VFRTVCGMVHLIPASACGNGNVPQRRNPSDNIGTTGGDLGVRPGESDSTPMVGGVLLLVLATIIIVPVLLWWLA
jgi:hypothetical protein